MIEIEELLSMSAEDMLTLMHKEGLGDYALAREMDMPRETIRDVRNSVRKNPAEDTVKKIREYFFSWENLR